MRVPVVVWMRRSPALACLVLVACATAGCALGGADSRPPGSQAPPRSAFPPRPRRFRLGRLRPGGVTEGCTQPRTRLFRFRDRQRLLYAWAVFGPGPDRGVRRQVERILDGITVAPLPGG